jgi:excisionase family DNA binding protein
VEVKEMSNETEPAVLSVSECAKYLSISRGSAYKGIMQNSIPHIVIGKRILIPLKSLNALLESASKPKE